MDPAIEYAEIRAILAEVAKGQKELQVSQKETEAKFKETDKRIKEAFALFEGQWGKLIESLVEGDLIRLLQERDVEIHRTTERMKGNYRGHNYEFDIIAHNGDEIVIVEVKTTLRVKHIQAFIEKLRHAKTWLPEYKAYKIYGAIAYLRSEENSHQYAENEKLFVIKATGKSAVIVNAPDFQPKAF